MIERTISRVGDVLAGLSPRAILVIGWLGLLAYAYPGYMSFDSIVQLGEARSGIYSDAHPPTMSALWAITDSVIAGPLGMLLVQSTCFVAGAYLVLRTCMSERAAAICTTLLVWFPPVTVVLAVIWKDGQMAAYLLLGTGLLLSPRRGFRIGGLLLLSAGTAMRYNALAITLPLVVLLFVWNPAHRWFVRYPIAIAAWLGLTLLASFVNAKLTDGEPSHFWHDSLALYDLTGTLRYAPDIPDDELLDDLAGTPIIAGANLQQIARTPQSPADVPEQALMSFGTGDYVPALWVTAFHVFAMHPTTEPERTAIARAWKRIVLAHPAAYLEYRWNVFREVIQLTDAELPSAAYVWFTDVLDLSGSAHKSEHSAAPSWFQVHVQNAMRWLGTSSLFRPYLYALLSLALLAFALRERAILALLLSGLANEAVLFVLAPTIDYRYSLWLVISTVLATMMLIAKRAGHGPAST